MKTKAITTIMLTLFLASILSMAFNVSPATAAISATNIRGYWHFDEGEGSIAYDSSDYGNDGILSGGGKFGSALKFDGVDDYVEVGNIGVTGDWTVEFWVKLDTVTPIIQYPIGTGPGAWYGSGTFVAFAWESDKWGVYDGASYILGSAVSANVWYHVAVSKSGTTYTLYLNSGYENSGTLADVDITNLQIGRRIDPAGGVWYFDGIIDEVRISNVARTSFDLTVPPLADANTVGLWHFDEGSGDIAYDASSNANHGTIYGATWTGTPPTWVDGKYGKALAFDGVDDYFKVPDDPSLDITAEITIDAWVYMRSPTTGYWIAIAGKAWGYPVTVSAYVLYIADSYPRLYIKGALCGSQWVTSSWQLSTNQWYHIAGTYDGSQLRIYVNGKLEGTSTFTEAIAVNDVDLIMGRRLDLEAYFDGILDEVRIWDIALPPEVVAVAATGTMEYLDKAGLVLFTSVFEGLSDCSSVTIYILPFDPSVNISSTSPIYVNRVTPAKTGTGAAVTWTDLEGFSVKVTVTSFGSPPSKTIHLWLYLNTGEHIGVNLQRAR